MRAPFDARGKRSTGRDLAGGRGRWRPRVEPRCPARRIRVRQPARARCAASGDGGDSRGGSSVRGGQPGTRPAAPTVPAPARAAATVAAAATVPAATRAAPPLARHRAAARPAAARSAGRGNVGTPSTEVSEFLGFLGFRVQARQFRGSTVARVLALLFRRSAFNVRGAVLRSSFLVLQFVARLNHQWLATSSASLGRPASPRSSSSRRCSAR